MLAWPLSFAGCILPSEPSFLSQAVAFKPPPEFAVWWRVTEACSGLQRDYSRVSWFVVPDSQLIVRGESYDGYSWQGADPRIVLTQSMLRNAGELVRHEMLHIIVGQGGHSKDYFRVRCGDLVACVDACADEAGTWATPDASSPVVDASALDVTLSVAPNPVIPKLDHWMCIVVTAHNPSKQAVWVRLASRGDPAGGPDDALWAKSLPMGATSVLMGGPLVPFDAGQTRRFVFDTRAMIPVPMPPGGNYTVTGGFSNAFATPVLVHVSP